MIIFNLNLDLNFKCLTYGYSQWQLGNHRSSELQGSAIRGKIENQQRNKKVGFQGSVCLCADLDFLHELYLYFYLYVYLYLSADLDFLHEPLDKIFVDDTIRGGKEGQHVRDEEPGGFK